MPKLLDLFHNRQRIIDSLCMTRICLMNKLPTVVWFRQDLRLSDNPALTEACISGSIIPVYILDDTHAGEHAMGAASRWWLHYSLLKLSQSLHHRLVIMRGDPLQIMRELLAASGAGRVVWNRCYEPWQISRDKQLKDQLRQAGISADSYNGSLLWEPWQVLKSDRTPYKVFTPFFRRGCMSAGEPALPLPAPAEIDCRDPDGLFPSGDQAIAALGLLPDIPWDVTMQQTWLIGEHAAQQRLREFLETGLQNYREGRNFPDKDNVSRLSPYLHHGEISPRQVWHAARAAGATCGLEHDLDTFLAELGWREFSYSLLYHNPDLPHQPIQARFNNFPWTHDAILLKAWQQGMTGYPLVDAGMRELWQTGYMHNRVRMVVGSFLVKNLLQHWHAGEQWFWDCLVDADLASNSASWQWIAGCGADAAPYFRVFNPVTQSEKFDPDGHYIRRYVPELMHLPAKYLHAPFAAPASVLAAAGVKLGENYPLPIVDLKQSREAALLAFKATQG
jgi:deoxyribodipyrimidine photo-lyase